MNKRRECGRSGGKPRLVVDVDMEVLVEAGVGVELVEVDIGVEEEVTLAVGCAVHILSRYVTFPLQPPGAVCKVDRGRLYALFHRMVGKNETY